MANDGTRENQFEKTNIDEINVIKEGEILLISNSGERLPRNYLHLAKESIGYELNAGIFKKDKNE